MNDTGPHSPPQAFRLKGTMPALTLLQLLTDDLKAIEQQLSDHLRQMPQFFLYAPVLVDLTEVVHTRVDLKRLAELLREHRLVPVAVRNPTEAQQTLAVAAGWGVLQNDLAPARNPPARSRRNVGTSEPAAPNSPSPMEATPSPQAVASSDPGELTEPPLPGLTIRTPVRSGQVIRAVGGDLVVLAPVSSGAELIADGNIHVYAPLRGRALAGAQGNSDVSIFCLGLEAEFLSIAGRYLMAEQIDKKYRGQATRAHLGAEGLELTAL